MVDRQEVAIRALYLLSVENPAVFNKIVCDDSMSATRMIVIKIADAYNRAESELKKRREETQALENRFSGQA